MTLVVQKFGGTSVGDADRIRAVADHIARTRRSGKDVVVVVSAMGKTTDGLIRLAEDVSSRPAWPRARHAVTAGERISMALLCMALAELAVAGRLFHRQPGRASSPTRPTPRRGSSKCEADRLREALAQGIVPVVAGFQGVSEQRDVTTLGRGGSDTTAVALAAALEADVCEIYTDVSGVFTADPVSCPRRTGSRGSPSRRCSRWPPRGQGPRPALGRVRPEPPHTAPRALQLHMGARAPSSPRRTLLWNSPSSRR